MLLHILIYVVPVIYGYYYANPITYNVGFCKFRAYFNHITNVSFRWILIAASFDRFALSSPNVRLRRLADVHIAYRVIVVIIAVVSTIHIYMIFVYGIRGNACPNMLSAIGLTAVTIFAMLNASLMPTLLMIVFTLLIRKNLSEKRERRHALTSQPSAASKNEQILLKRDQQILRMLFTQIIAFFVITIPWMIYSINNIISPYVPDKTADRIAIESFIGNVAGGLNYIFPSASFYIYTLTSSLFRKELWCMLRSWFCCQWASTNHRVEAGHA